MSNERSAFLGLTIWQAHAQAAVAVAIDGPPKVCDAHARLGTKRTRAGVVLVLLTLCRDCPTRRVGHCLRPLDSVLPGRARDVEACVI